MTLINNFEGILSNLSNVAITILNNLFGVRVKIYPVETSNIYSNVYTGQDGDTSIISSEYRECSILFTGDIYQYLNSSYSDIAFIGDNYCFIDQNTPELKSGERIVYTREDGKEIRFTVKDRLPIGFTTEIVKKYRILYIEE